MIINARSMGNDLQLQIKLSEAAGGVKLFLDPQRIWVRPEDRRMLRTYFHAPNSMIGINYYSDKDKKHTIRGVVSV